MPSRPDGRKRRLRVRRRRRREGDRSHPAAGPRVARRLRRRPGRDPLRPTARALRVLFGALIQALRMRAFNMSPVPRHKRRRRPPPRSSRPARTVEPRAKTAPTDAIRRLQPLGPIVWRVTRTKGRTAADREPMLTRNGSNIAELRSSRGRITGFGDAPLLLLTTIGAKSGASHNPDDVSRRRARPGSGFRVRVLRGRRHEPGHCRLGYQARNSASGKERWMRGGTRKFCRWVVCRTALIPALWERGGTSRVLSE